MDFCSDNTSGVAPEIMAALDRVNRGRDTSYGDDATSARLTRRLCELFEAEVAVFPVATGTAANALALSVMSPSFGAIYCHRHAHIEIDECGAPEFYTGGAKLVPLDGADGKLEADVLAAKLAEAGAGFVHHVQPAAVSLTQATECGTVYTLDEVAALSEIARAHGLGFHMDGARFANALVELDCTPADMTWRAGVELLSFGATKNGAMGAEAIVVFKTALASELGYRHKRGGHLFSKMRFVSAQLEAYVNDGLWLRNAAHANRLATTLAEGLAAVPGAELLFPVEGNELFVRLPESVIGGLLADGFTFYRWPEETSTTIRLVTAFNTREDDVEAFITAARRHADGAAQKTVGAQ